MAISDLIERVSGKNPNREENDEEWTSLDPSLADLDDDLLDSDPAPAKSAGRSKSSGTPTKSTAGQRKQVKDALMVMIGLPAGMVSLRDPTCGAAVNDQAGAIADALVPIICRNPAMLAWFIGAGAPWLQWAVLIAALRPVASTIWAHHVSHTIGLGDDEEDTSHEDYATAYPAPVLR